MATEFQTVGAAIENDLSATELISGGRCSLVSLVRFIIREYAFTNFKDFKKIASSNEL